MRELPLEGSLSSPNKMETLAEPPPQSFPSLEAEAAFWRERAAVAEAAARDAREELEEFQVIAPDCFH